MSKRGNDCSRRVLIRGLGAGVTADTVQSFFCQLGQIEFVRFTVRKACLVQFEAAETAIKALEFDNTRQAPLGAMALTVTLDQEDATSKKSRCFPSSFYLVDPPLHNNYMIPTLVSFITKKTSV
jgi:RNA recognition motif-containing protein